MGRPLRIQSPELHYHVIVRCNNEAFRFRSDSDFICYLEVLKKVKKKHHFRLFNYELMSSHVHLFLQPSESVPLQETMLLINWSFSRAFNKKNRRKGHFWLDRYKSIPVETDKYALDLMRYINRNAVRAGLVKSPVDWKWSGYRYYALGEENSLLEPHPTFLGLSNDDVLRRRAYSDYVNMSLPGDEFRKPSFSDRKFIGSEMFGEKLGLSTVQF